MSFLFAFFYWFGVFLMFLFGIYRLREHYLNGLKGVISWLITIAHYILMMFFSWGSIITIIDMYYNNEEKDI